MRHHNNLDSLLRKLRDISIALMSCRDTERDEVHGVSPRCARRWREIEW